MAVIPAVIVISYYGENSTSPMLVLSQVILSLQLPFAIIPLIHAVANKRRMGEFHIKPWLQGLAWLVAGVIVALNVKLIIDQIATWLGQVGSRAWLLEATVIPVSAALGLLLVYVSIHPWIGKRFRAIAWPRLAGVHQEPAATSERVLTPEPYRRIAIALDFSGHDEKLLAESLRFLRPGETRLVLLHVVESPVARALGERGEDYEMQADRNRLKEMARLMQAAGFKVSWQLGTGDPGSELARMLNEMNVDMVIVGSHGHAGVSDLIHGTVINYLRHQIQANLLVIPLAKS
jgi:manganese transport protein